MKKVIIYAVLLANSLVLTSCNKYLDANPDKSLVVPTKIKELQGLMDQDAMYSIYPANSILADDNFYYTAANFATLTDAVAASYTWSDNANALDDWSGIYNRILYCNIALGEIDNLVDIYSSQVEKNNVKGSALFYRAYNFFEATQIFSPQYVPATAETDLGIPLKTSPDAENQTIRATMKDSYEKILSDLKIAINLLPATQTVSTYKTRPSAAACYGELARIYLVIGNYDSAFRYADQCLQTYNTLIDYNNTTDVALTSTTPFKRFNNEVIFHTSSRSSSGASAGFGKQMVDTILYSSYVANDLRKSAFYKVNTPGFTFKGNYNASTLQLFTGLAVDEIYLIRSECYARNGNMLNALNDLNTLLVKRWVTGTFTPLTTANTPDVLSVILKERRKELVFRGLRWSDLRRLNLDEKYKTTIVRNVNNQTYSLTPNDKKYTFLIPQIVIDQSGISQNPR